MALKTVQDPVALSEIAQSLHDYLDPNAQNLVLPAFDFDHISDVMKQITVDMERIHVHADTYEEAALTARKKARHMQSILNSYLNLSIPLVRMPTEILTLLFENRVRSDTGGYSLSHEAMPLVLSHVCRRWRMVVNSTPSLWQIIRLHNRKTVAHNRRLPPLSILRLWLDRSEPLPISCLAILDAPDLCKYNLKILNLLIKHSRRWFTVHFSFGNQGSLYHRLCSIPPFLPLLHYFRVEVDIPIGTHEVFATWTAPNLEAAALLVQSSSTNTQPTIALPWFQFEALVWFPATPRSFLDISTAFLSLRRCCLQISHHIDVDDLHQFTLPHLRQFEISGSYQSIIGTLCCVSLPALEILDVDPDEHIGPVADQLLSAIERLQLRSPCDIRCFSAPFSLFSSNELALESKIDTIQELRVLVSTEEDNNISIINLIDSNTLRNLKVLHLLFRESPDEDLTLLHKMVELVTFRRRWKSSSGARLDELSLDVIRTSDVPNMHISVQSKPFQRLFELQQEGLSLLGSAVNGEWHSFFGDTRWSNEDLQRAARYWERFGYSDWLFEQEIDDYITRRHTS